MAFTSTTLPPLLLLSVALLQLLLFVTPTSSFTPESDILLSFKASIEDHSNSLSTWSNTSSSSHCSWAGITCTGAAPLSVTSINLQTLNLSGEISSSICNLPNLTHLNLAGNFFNQAIPLHLSQCSSLQTLNLSNNLIWGTIPDQISVFRTLTVLDFSRNPLEGKIPDAIGSLRKLRVLNFGSNLLSGTVPPVFANFTELAVLDLSQNPYLMSEIPIEIAALENLEQIFLQRSGFYGQIPASLVNLQKLSILDLSQNNLTGGFPQGDVGESLVSLDVSENRLGGSLPAGICSSRLISLSLHTNRFNGSLPSSITKCLSLEKLQVQNNDFSGEGLLWSLPKIKILRAENNRFSGEIPDLISTSVQLEQLQIDNNTFTGRIPRGLGLVKTLYRFSASMNHLAGEIPPNFCDSPAMSIINLSHNALLGPIPEMTKCKKLVSLSLSNNSLAGEIPSSLSELPVLTYLDLSANNLSGPIPKELQNLKLALFNVSFNQLSGPVPLPLISGLPASFLDGNPGLCGPGLSKSCSGHQPNHTDGLTTLACALISVGFGVGILVIAGCFLAYHKSLMQRSQGAVWRSVFFYPLRVTEQDLITRMDDKTAVGTGSPFGQVYVLSLPSGELITVKKLVNFRNHSPKTLKSDIKTLAKTRHKNIAKILGFCHSDESIFIIYENLPGGSLSGLIQNADFDLDWRARLGIAIGVAQGLEYLHKDYVPCLLHRNVKSSNIVLDGEFVPKLTDFGFDRVLGEVAFQTTVASKSSSSCYISPESGYSKKATAKMDVYSFGVVLLELLTGRQSEQVDSSTEDSHLDIVKWVRRKINITNGAFEILDSRISEASHRHEMMVALEIALRCTSVMPEKRPSMSQVVRSLQSLGSSASAKNKAFSSSEECLNLNLT